LRVPETALPPEELDASCSLEMAVPEEQIVAGNTSHTRPENRAFYPALDGLRAIAFLMVFSNHYLFIPWGWAGVDLFFVLSGFLITGILFDSRNDPHRIRNFYVRRTLRIFPLYYGVMLLLIPFAYRGLSWSWLVWPAYLGNYARVIGPYTSGSPLQRLADFQPGLQVTIHGIYRQILFLGHFWSLCVEEQFYLVWPWIVFWIRDRRKLLWICASSVPFCVAARLIGQHVLPAWMLENKILYCLTPFRLDALLLGGCLALLIRGPYRDLLLRTVRLIWPVTLIPISLWAISISNFFPYSEYRYPAWSYTWGLLAIDLLGVLIIACAIQPGSLVYRALNQRLLRWLGRISYGAYVLHDIPHLLYLDFGGGLVASHSLWHALLLIATIALISTCVLAWLSYRFFESPFLNLKERWTIRNVT
jgi:peptidoglycan/LPS O-acetylase OafA/YrhL